MEFPSRARVYADANSRKPREYWDYKNFRVDWRDHSKYELVRKLGYGSYSEVFEGRNMESNERCAIKVLKPFYREIIRKEVKILTNLKGGTNIITLQDSVLEPHLGIKSLIFEYVDDIDHRELYEKFTFYDIRHYAYELLKALDYSHTMGIMHRDVKPFNIVFDHHKKLYLIDWGMAEFYHPGKSYDVSVASRGFEAPELLLDFKMYDYSLDMWSFGCIFASMIFRMLPFFYSVDKHDHFFKIVDVLGTDKLYDYLRKYNMKLNLKVIDKLGTRPKKMWQQFVNKGNAHLTSSKAFDLLDKILRYDHFERLTAREAMQHPYFNRIYSPYHSF